MINLRYWALMVKFNCIADHFKSIKKDIDKYRNCEACRDKLVRAYRILADICFAYAVNMISLVIYNKTKNKKKQIHRQKQVYKCGKTRILFAEGVMWTVQSVNRNIFTQDKYSTGWLTVRNYPRRNVDSGKSSPWDNQPFKSIQQRRYSQ